MKNCKLTCLICSLMLISPAAFAKPEITLCGELAQGKIIKGHGENLQKIRINGANHQVDKNGDFIFALPREQKAVPYWKQPIRMAKPIAMISILPKANGTFKISKACHREK